MVAGKLAGVGGHAFRASASIISESQPNLFVRRYKIRPRPEDSYKID